VGGGGKGQALLIFSAFTCALAKTKRAICVVAFSF